MSTHQCDPLTARHVIRVTQGLLDNPLFIRADQRKAFNLLISRIADLDEDSVLSAEAKANAYLIEPWTNGMPPIYCDLLRLGKADAASAFLRNASQRLDATSEGEKLGTIECYNPEAIGVAQG